MKLRFMKINPHEVIVRLNIDDLADLFYCYDLECVGDSSQELADALRAVLIECDPLRFKFLSRD